MWFYYLIYFVLVAAFYIAVYYDIQKPIYVCCLLLLAIIVGLRPASCCADYLNYQDYYFNLQNINVVILEPTYFIIAWIAKLLFNSPIGVFLIYGFLGVFTKGIAFTRLSNFYLLSLIIYSGTFFLLHEMTQIRVGIASSILLMSIPLIYKRKIFGFLGIIVLGTLFHYSFLIFIFFYFLDPHKINPLFYIGIIVMSFLIYLSGINTIMLLEHIPIDFVADKVRAYNSLLEMGIDTKINVFNILVIFRIFFLSILLWKWEFLYEKNKYSVLLIKIYAFSTFFFVFLYALPVMAFRVRELLGIVEVILVPFVVYLLKEKHVAFVIVLLIGLILMSIDIWYNDLIHNYF